VSLNNAFQFFKELELTKYKFQYKNRNQSSLSI